MNKTIIILSLILFWKVALTQDTSVTFSGSFDQLPFAQFAEELKEKVPVNIYYQPETLKDVKVTVSGSDIDLINFLNNLLKDLNVNIYSDDAGNIIIYKGKPIIAHLPDYKTLNPVTDKNEVKKADEITATEKMYMAGKTVKQLELITVGNPGSTSNGKMHIVSGRITEKETGNPILGATVFIKQLGLGAATDNDGYFSLTLKSGKYLVEANSISRAEKKFYLQVYSDGSIDIPLEKELHNIMEVTVVADRHNNVKGMQMGFARVTAKSMKEIPAVLGEKDLLKVALMLPGVQNSGEGSSGLNVRGGTADQNLFYINKLPIYNTSHLFGFFTAFNPDIVNDFTMYKSNVPAKYGGRISSVFDISTRQGNKKEFYGKGGISPVTAHIEVEGPVIKDNTSFVLSYRGTYSDWLLSRMNDINLKNSHASFYDWSALINSDINDNNHLKVFSYQSYDQFSLSNTDDYNYANLGGSALWKHIFSPSFKADFSLVNSQYNFGHNDKSNPTEAYRQVYDLSHTELKGDFIYLSEKNHRISFGASSILYNLNRGTISPYGEESNRIPIDFGKEKGLESALYISDEFSITPKLTTLVGLRYSFYMLFGPAEVNKYFPNSPIDKNNIRETISFSRSQIVKFYSAPEPRIAFNYRLGANNSVKTSFNRIRQYIFMLSNTIAIAPTDQWKLSDYHIKPPTTDQISFGYYHDFPTKGLVTSAEIYRKWTKNIVEYKDGVDFISNMNTEMLLLQGKQNSYGIEFMFRKNTGKFTGWLSYCYSRSIIQVKSDLPTEQINYGNPYPSNYDRPHSLNLVTTLRSNRRLSVSANIVYSTGRPITYPISTYYNEGQELLHFSERNKYRIPDYFRVDLSVNLEGNLNRKKWIHSFWMLNFYNLTGRKNAYSVYFESNEGTVQGYKLSVFGQPIVTLSWNFKFGNYASE